MTSLLNADGRQGLGSLANGEHIDEVVRKYRIADDVQLRIIPAGQTPSNPTGLLDLARECGRLSVRGTLPPEG